jgi:hypothetical protein
MTEDIEGGLSVVIEAVATCDLPSEEALAWCSATLAADRMGFIARKPLEILRRRLQAAKAKRSATRLTGGRRAPLRPASGPTLPGVEPFATRTPIGLPPSSARGGRFLHACRKDTTTATTSR